VDVGRQKTILLVEDEFLIALAEKKTLEKYGFSVVSAGTGEQAVEKATGDPGIDLVLMDIDLGPGMDGTRAARAILETRELPVVFLSSHTERQVVEMTEGITSYGYIVKNSGETVLIASVKMAFRLFEARLSVQAQKMEMETAYEETQVSNETLLRTQRELVEHELALAESEAKYRRLIENSHDLIYTLSPEGMFTFVSRSWTAMLGHAVDEVIGKPFAPFVHPDDLPACSALLREVVETGRRAQNVEYRVRHLDGSWRWHSSDAAPMRDASGAIFAYEGSTRDITERKLAEAKIREQMDELRRWVDAGLGREERILELKREVNSMFAGAGLPPRYPSAAEASRG